MKIRWHKRAEASLRQVEQYVLENFGEKVRQEFMDEVEKSVGSLAEMPTLGRLDPLFAHRQIAYRSIIVRNLNKVVYYIKNDAIHVAAFWDTRREPKNQARNTR